MQSLDLEGSGVGVGAESRVEVGKANTEGLGVEGASVILILAVRLLCYDYIMVECLARKVTLSMNLSRLNEADSLMTKNPLSTQYQYYPKKNIYLKILV